MSITVSEKWESRPTTLGEQPSLELVYTVQGTDDDVAAQAALLTIAPAVYVTADGSVVRQDSRIERIGQYAWEGTVRYGKKEPKETGESSFSFDTGGGTQHITQSIETVNKYSISMATPAPDFHGAVGVTKDSVEGVDITVPVYNFSETHYLDVALVTGGYKATLFNLTGTVNNGSFRGFAAGEVLFLGASGSQRGQEDWEIAFRFAASPNATGLTVGEITGIDKKGWEYLWVRYADAEDATAKVLVKKPVSAYVEKVYGDGNFSGLGIGT